MERTKPPPSPWKSGSFYLVVFLVAIMVLAVVGHIVPIIALPVILVGGILALSMIGAFQMRHDEKLSQENFLKLMALSLRYILWIKRQDEKPAK
jgi:Flp pilus assembly protein TadB